MSSDRYTTQNINKVLADIVSSRASTGDEIILQVKWKGKDKPEVFIKTLGHASGKDAYALNLSPFFPDTPQWVRKFADGTIDNTGTVGYKDWKDFIQGPLGLTRMLQNLCTAGQRALTILEI